VGAELRRPILTEDAFAAGFTNELGVDGTVRFNRNLTGLWLLQECQRTWRASGADTGVAELVAAAAREPGLVSVVDAGSEVFSAPDDMPARIAAECVRTGQPVPQGHGAMVRCVLDSLALAHARAVRQVERLGGPQVRVVHLVGGGTRNELLCQLTADACGLPVVAGPVEAAALGNIVVQARAMGTLSGDLPALRRVIAAGGDIRRYEPTGRASDWDAADARLN
jgi:rhamnulokinase